MGTRLRTMKTLRIERRNRQEHKVLYKADFPTDALVDVRKVIVGGPESDQIEVVRVTVTVPKRDEEQEKPKIKPPQK